MPITTAYVPTAHTSVLCAADSPTRFPWDIETNLEEEDLC